MYPEEARMSCDADPGSPAAIRGLRAVVLGTVLAVFLASGAASQSGAFELRDGAVVDPGTGLIYLMSPGGGIDAVSLAFGTVRWHSDAAGRPISASAAGILAQAEAPEPGSLQLAVLDTSGRLLRSAAVDLPAGVEAPVIDGLSRRFRIRGVPAGSGDGFRVEWRSTYLAPRGALILDEASGPRVRTGAFTFDPATGVVVDTEASEGIQGPQIEVPEGQRLDVSGRQFFSADRRHRLASVPGVGSAAETYDWTFFDSSGGRLGSFSNRVSFAPFHVHGDLVVFETRPGAWRQGDQMVEEPLSLRAVTLSSGAEQWRFAIRDTEYRGPFPP